MLEPLNNTQIQSEITSENLARLHSIEILQCVNSTNTYLLEKAKTTCFSGIFCFAEEQTQGRGRRGKKWHSDRGAHICGSVLWRFSNLKNISSLSLAVATIALSALEKYGIESGLQLKWPNDIWYAGRKLAGILLESVGNAVVIGIGLNLYLPQAAESSWISVFDITRETVARNRLTGLLVNELLAQLPMYEQKGFDSFKNRWNKYDVLLNKQVAIETTQGIFSGIMQGVTDQGELILNHEQGCMYFNYGEVSVRSK